MKLVGYACRHPDPPLRTAFLPLSELTILLGPNDSGKSSLLRAVERDLSGGHFDEVDEERAKLIGGVFYVEVSDNELARSPSPQQGPETSSAASTGLERRGAGRRGTRVCGRPHDMRAPGREIRSSGSSACATSRPFASRCWTRSRAHA